MAGKSSTLNLYVNLRKAVWKLAPLLFYLLAKTFCDWLPEKFAELVKSLEDGTILAKRGNDRMEILDKDAYRQKCQDFCNILSLLTLDTPAEERVLTDAYLIGSCFSAEICESLARRVGRAVKLNIENFVVYVYVKYGKHELNRARTLNKTKQKVVMSCFVPDTSFLGGPKGAKPINPTDERLAACRAKLQEYFGAVFDSTLCEIDTMVNGKRRYIISIAHAGSVQHDNRAVEDKQDIVVYQSVEHDIIIFDTQRHELGIHLEQSFRTELLYLYIKVIGYLFFERENYWQTKPEYSFAHLQKHSTLAGLRRLLDVERAKKIIEVPDGELVRIRMPEVHIVGEGTDGKKFKRPCLCESCVTTTLTEKGERLVPKNHEVTKIKIVFDCKYKGKRETVVLYLTEGSKSMTSSPVELLNIDEWLSDSHFSSPSSILPEYPVAEWFGTLSAAEEAAKIPVKKVEGWDELGLYRDSNEPT